MTGVRVVRGGVRGVPLLLIVAEDAGGGARLIIAEGCLSVCVCARQKGERSFHYSNNYRWSDSFMFIS